MSFGESYVSHEDEEIITDPEGGKDKKKAETADEGGKKEAKDNVDEYASRIIPVSLDDSAKYDIDINDPNHVFSFLGGAPIDSFSDRFTAFSDGVDTVGGDISSMNASLVLHYYQGMTNALEAGKIRSSDDFVGAVLGLHRLYHSVERNNGPAYLNNLIKFVNSYMKAYVDGRSVNAQLSDQDLGKKPSYNKFMQDIKFYTKGTTDSERNFLVDVIEERQKRVK